MKSSPKLSKKIIRVIAAGSARDSRELLRQQLTDIILYHYHRSEKSRVDKVFILTRLCSLKIDTLTFLLQYL